MPPSLSDEAKSSVLPVATTNDNLNALRFYRQRSFRIRALRPHAGTLPQLHQAGGAIVGFYLDGSNVSHGFLVEGE